MRWVEIGDISQSPAMMTGSNLVSVHFRILPFAKLACNLTKDCDLRGLSAKVQRQAMISAILFGRNDDHGGAFRHRAVLAINMLAEQLDTCDEIVFVDWNSANNAPTFPEAVAPSLTERARSLLRVIRVGSDIHAQYVIRGTAMPVVPVVAYNAGIRRTNPQNKWILITTSDLLLISREAGHTLSNIAASLQDGAYGLPRFELPRWIWQGLDPNDPLAAMRCLSDFGKRLHLEEAIRLPPPELFDSPGDFLLMLRTDLASIDGFDEGMFVGALGPDSNLLKRLALMGRRTQSLERRFAGYHCNHTASSPAASHRADRLQNDRQFYFDEVEASDLSFQRTTWGLAKLSLPETRLAARNSTEAASTSKLGPADQAAAALLPQRLAVVSEAIGPAQPTLYDTAPRYNSATYPTRHVVPFLLDNVFEQSDAIIYVGTNERLTSYLAAILKRLEPQRRLTCFQPSERVAFEQHCRETTANNEQPLLIFDFGIDAGTATHGPRIQQTDAAVRCSLTRVRECFIWCVNRHREASERRSLRIVAINATNTEFEQLVLAHVNCSLSPFITRMRGGTAYSDFPPRVPILNHAAAGHMAERLGRKRGLHVGEFARALAIVNGLVRKLPAEDVPATWRVPSVDALLDWPGIAALTDVQGGRIAEVKSWLAASRERVPRAAGPPHRRDTVAAAKFASAQDWENPEWYDIAYWYLGDHGSYNVFERHRRDWEHIHFLFCLAKFGILDTDAEVVVFARERNRFPQMLSQRVKKVHLVNVGWKSNGRLVRLPEFRSNSAIQVYSGPSDPAFCEIAAAALIAQRPNVHPLARSSLKRTCQVLKPNGMIGISLDVAIRPAQGLGRLVQWLHLQSEIGDLANHHGAAKGTRATQFTPVASEDWTVDPESFELVTSSKHWRLRQMTADRHGQRVTTAIQWFSRIA